MPSPVLTAPVLADTAYIYTTTTVTLPAALALAWLQATIILYMTVPVTIMTV